MIVYWSVFLPIFSFSHVNVTPWLMCSLLFITNHSFTYVYKYPNNDPQNPVFVPISPTHILTILQKNNTYFD